MLITRVADAFAKKKVKYAIVGGYAVALHGAVRGTVDLDLIIQLDIKSFENAEAALKSIGLQPRLPVTAKEVFQFRKEYIEKRNLIAWSFANPQSPTEIVDIVITHNLDRVRTVTKKIGAMGIQVASIADLIKMKKQSGRPQDLEDVAALEKLK